MVEHIKVYTLVFTTSRGNVFVFVVQHEFIFIFLNCDLFKPVLCPVSPHPSPCFLCPHSHTWELSVRHAHMFAGSARVAGWAPICWGSGPGQAIAWFDQQQDLNRQRWRWGQSYRACILQIRVKHHLHAQDRLFSMPLTWPWLLKPGKCVCGVQICVSERIIHTFFFSLIGKGTMNFSLHFLMWSDQNCEHTGCPPVWKCVCSWLIAVQGCGLHQVQTKKPNSYFYKSFLICCSQVHLNYSVVTNIWR